ncbi:MAG: four helix bundle protein [Fidelibacterota bacterium]
MQLAVDVFNLTDTLPKKEDYGFTSQIRRSALSISANIAEAFGRNHTSDKINFYYYARGSITETISHLEYGTRVNYITNKRKKDMVNTLLKLQKGINQIIASLRSK